MVTRPTDDRKNVRVRERLRRKDHITHLQIKNHLADIVDAPHNRKTGDLLANPFPIQIDEPPHIVPVTHAASQSPEQLLCGFVRADNERASAKNALAPFRDALTKDTQHQPPRRKQYRAEKAGENRDAATEAVVFEEEYQSRDEYVAEYRRKDGAGYGHAPVRVHPGRIETRDNNHGGDGVDDRIGVDREPEHLPEPQQLPENHTQVYQEDVDEGKAQGLEESLQHRKPGRDRNRQPKKKRKEMGMTQMFFHEQTHGMVKRANLVEVTPFRALTFVVDDFRRMHVVVLPPRLLKPVAPVQILPVHKEILVQAADVFIRLAANHDEGAAHGIDLIRFIGTKIGQIVLTKKPGIWEQGTETRHFRESDPGGRETPPASELKRSIGIKDLAAGEPDVRVLVEELDHHPQRVLLHESVRIDQQQILAPRTFERNVVRFRKPKIGLISNYFCLREILPD